MYRIGPALALLPLLAACTTAPPDQPNVIGEDMSGYFPSDGERTWFYIDENGDTNYYDAAVLMDDTRTDELRGNEIFTIAHFKDCRSEIDCVDKEPLWSMEFSSDYGDGIFLHSLGDTVFDEPIKLTARRPLKGDSFQTTTNGATYTSTYEDKVDCEHNYPGWTGENDPECVWFTVDDGGAGTGHNFEFWSAGGVGWTAFRFEAEGKLWLMREVQYER